MSRPHELRVARFFEVKLPSTSYGSKFDAPEWILDITSHWSHREILQVVNDGYSRLIETPSMSQLHSGEENFRKALE